MSRRTREALAAYGFLSPWIAGMLVLTIGPMIYSLYLSFTRYNLMTPAQWVGAENYVRMFTADPRYLASVSVTLCRCCSWCRCWWRWCSTRVWRSCRATGPRSTCRR
jgi:ABC-type sugar transport system permease subunit